MRLPCVKLLLAYLAAHGHRTGVVFCRDQVLIYSDAPASYAVELWLSVREFDPFVCAEVIHDGKQMRIGVHQ